MKYHYTAIFTQDEHGAKYYCRVLDLPGCITTGDSIDDAIEMITDAASSWLVVAEDEGNEIPAPTPQNDLNSRMVLCNCSMSVNIFYEK